MKFFYGWMACLLIFTVNADEIYQMQGIISLQSADASTVVIDNQQYNIDFDTRVHGMVRQGERGPQFNDKQKIGFNVEQKANEISRISEIWFVE
jgi:hypothetical protein